MLKNTVEIEIPEHWQESMERIKQENWFTSYEEVIGAIVAEALADPRKKNTIDLEVKDVL
jgi:hypothetical protein